MKPNKLLRYFKASNVPEVISVLLILAGAFIYYYAWQIWVLATPLLLIGLAGLVISMSFKISDQKFEDYFNAKLEEMPKERELTPEYTASEYSFVDNHFAKLDKTGAPRSEIYIRTILYFDKQLKLVRGMVNMETGEKEFQTYIFAHAFAEVNNSDFNVGKLVKKMSVMTITDGEQSCSFPVKYNDIEIDQLIERLNKRYAKPNA